MDRVEMNGKCGAGLSLFLTGLATGIAVALLVAPASGRGTRRFLGSRLHDGEEWVKAKAAAAEEYAVNQTNAVRDRVKEAAEVLVRT